MDNGGSTAIEPDDDYNRDKIEEVDDDNIDYVDVGGDDVSTCDKYASMERQVMMMTMMTVLIPKSMTMTITCDK